MKITFTPIRSDAVLHLEKAGEMLVVNGRALDLSAATAEHPLARDALGCDWLLSDVRRCLGTLELTLALPYGACEIPGDPAGLTLVLAQDGPVSLPVLETEVVADGSDEV